MARRRYGILVPALLVLACSSGETSSGAPDGGGGTAGSGGATYWIASCPGCECAARNDSWQDLSVSLECFCCGYTCEPGMGPFGNGIVDRETIVEYADCQRRLVEGFAENPIIGHIIDTETETVVGAYYADDSGICGGDAQTLIAGEAQGLNWRYGQVLPGCTASSCTIDGEPVPCEP